MALIFYHYLQIVLLLRFGLKYLHHRHECGVIHKIHVSSDLTGHFFHHPHPRNTYTALKVDRSYNYKFDGFNRQ